MVNRGRPHIEIAEDELRYAILAVDLDVMTVTEVCEELQISRSTFYRLRGDEGYEELPL